LLLSGPGRAGGARFIVPLGWLMRSLLGDAGVLPMNEKIASHRHRLQASKTAAGALAVRLQQGNAWRSASVVVSAPVSNV